MRVVLLVTLVYLLSLYKGFSQELKVQLDGCKITPRDLHFMRTALTWEVIFYEEFFNKKIDSTRYSATIYGTKDAFRKVVKHSRHTQGYYDIEERKFYLFIQPKFNSVFQHELSHALFDQLCSQDGGWVNEGIAEYFSLLNFSENNPVLDTDPDILIHVKELLGNNYSIKHFVTLSYADWKKLPSNINYRMAWAIVNFLITSNIDVFRDILYQICDTNDIKTAIDDNYPGGFDLFEGDLKSFYLNYLFFP